MNSEEILSSLKKKKSIKALTKPKIRRQKVKRKQVTVHDKIKKYERFSDFRLLTLFIDHNGFLFRSSNSLL